MSTQLVTAICGNSVERQLIPEFIATCKIRKTSLRQEAKVWMTQVRQQRHQESSSGCLHEAHKGNSRREQRWKSQAIGLTHRHTSLEILKIPWGEKDQIHLA